MASRTLKVEIVGDASSLSRAFGKAGNSSSSLSTNLLKVGKAAALAGAALSVAVAVGVKKAIDAASDLGEQLTKTSVVFGDSSKQVHRWSEDLAGSFGISQRAALEAAGTFGNMLVPMGFGRKEAAGMSKQFVELAADMASFNNATPEETLLALRAGLAGQAEPLRKFGIFLDAARIKSQAAAMGFKEVKGQLDPMAKAAATAAIIMKDTADTQGDFERTSGGLANQQRILRAELENAAAAIGTALLPAATALVGLLARLVPVVADFGVKLTEAVGPHVTSAIAAISPAFQTLKTAVTDLLNTARQLAPVFQQIGGVGVGIVISQLGQGSIAATVAMLGFHKAITLVVERLIALRAAAAGAGLAALVSPVGLLTAAMGALVFAFISTRGASDAVGDSIDRQRAALLALRDATNDAANSEQRLKDAKIAVKQATLDVSKALERRNVLEQDGKQKTQDYTQAQIDVQRAYANRQRAELELRQSSEGVTDASNKGKEAIKGLGEAAETARAKLRRGTEALGEFGNETGKHQVVNAYAREMERLAKQADAVAKNSKNVAPNIAAAAVAFASQARAAAAVAKKTGEIPAAFQAVVGPSRVAGTNIGTALGQGIQVGIIGQVANISAAAAGAVRAAEAAARAEAKAKSPSELFAAIGRDIDEGLKKGIVEGYAKLKGASKDAADKMIDAATQAILDKRGVFASAFDGLVSAATAAFDKLSSEFETKTEKKIAAQDERRAKADRQRALAAANAALSAAKTGVGFEVPEGETPEDAAKRVKAQAAAVKQAEQDKADAVFAIKRAHDEKIAAQERKDYEAKRERQQVSLNNRLSDLQASFLQGEITVTQFTARMAKILDKAGIPAKKAAIQLGAALAAGLNEAKKDAVNAAKELAQAIIDQLGNISVVVKVHVSSSRSGKDDDHRAAGGPVKRGKQYLVGEQGPELFVPSASGKIVSNANLAAGGARALGGGGTMVFNFPNYVGDRRELEDAMQSIMLTYQRRNGFGFAG